MNNNSLITWKVLDNASSLHKRWQGPLKQFWQSMQSGVLSTQDNAQLRYYFYQNSNANQAVFISSGRAESAIKYAELCYELVQAGYSVFLLDHRGQGLSSRELSNTDKGYITSFKTYQQDMALFVNTIMLPMGHQTHIALGHSMGCAILAGYLQQHPHPFKAAIFASPMFGIYTGFIPEKIAQCFASLLFYLNKMLSKTPWYFPMQSNYKEKPYEDNNLTSCPLRYSWMQNLYKELPQARLGGATTAWINAAIQAMQQIEHDAPTWQLPTLLLQAGSDTVVCNKAQQRWFENTPSSLYKKRVVIAGAKHEILLEKDEIRAQAFNEINAFLEQLGD